MVIEQVAVQFSQYSYSKVTVISIVLTAFLYPLSTHAEQWKRVT